MSTQVEGVASAASKLAPSITAGGLTIFGVPLPDIVLVATLVYTILQTYFLVKDRWIAPRIKRRKEIRVNTKRAREKDHGSYE